MIFIKHCLKDQVFKSFVCEYHPMEMLWHIKSFRFSFRLVNAWCHLEVLISVIMLHGSEGHGVMFKMIEKSQVEEDCDYH
jgi:hypothetical protein